MTNNGVTFKWLLKKIRRNIPSLLLLALCSIGSSLSGVCFALGTKNIIDAAVAGQRDSFFRACVIQVCIILCILLCTALLQHLKERMHATLDKTWKITLLHDLMESEYRCVSAFHSSELVNRLNNDVRILDDGIVNLLPNLCAMITKLAAAFGVLTTLTPWFTAALLCAGLFVILLTGFFRRHLKGLHKRVSEADGRVSGILQETLEKLLAVQAMGITEEIKRRVQIRLDERFVIQCKRKNISLVANTCINIMYYGAGFAALICCSFGLLNGAMTFGTMTAIIQLVNQLQRPLVDLSGIAPQFASATASAERLCELDLLPKTPLVAENSAIDIYNRMDCIVAEGLSFTYDRDCILDQAAFSVQKGCFCVITGPSGVGKSTLLKLLLGIFTPEHGELYLRCGANKIPVNAGTRQLFAYVPQGNFIFSGSIKDNLLVVRPDASEKEIERAVYVSAMDTFLQQLPDGLDTVLGEGGAGLSEGQIQRLAIARAILGGAPILLLDECTSALDAQTELIVLERLRNLKDKTCITVTHRPIAETICDVNIIINKSKIETYIKQSVMESVNGK